MREGVADRVREMVGLGEGVFEEDVLKLGVTEGVVLMEGGVLELGVGEGVVLELGVGARLDTAAERDGVVALVGEAVVAHRPLMSR